MTDSLRDALREAAADGTHHGSGVTGRDLLRRGHRKARLRRISGTTAGGLALAALVSIPLAPSLWSEAGDETTNGESTADPASIGPRTSAALDPYCQDAEQFADWTLRAAVRGDGHATAVLTSPDGTKWGQCMGSEGSEYVAVPVRANVKSDPGYTYLRHNMWHDDGCIGGDRTCAWGIAGQIPTEIARMTFVSADGRTSAADVDDGFFAWQSTVDDIDVFNQPLWVTLYDADGDQIDRLNANRDPDEW